MSYCVCVCVCATFVGVCCEALRVTTRLMILAGVKTWVFFIREIAALYQSHDRLLWDGDNGFMLLFRLELDLITCN